jgi:hypothetical protein
MTFKIFTDSEEEFNLVPRSFANIKSLCRVMLECPLTDDEAAYFMQLGGINEETVKKKWNKHNWLQAVAELLFLEKPKVVGKDSADAEAIRDAYDFFLNSFGETAPDVKKHLNGVEVIQAVNYLISTANGSHGDAELRKG